jgi:hypothetical protein
MADHGNKWDRSANLMTYEISKPLKRLLLIKVALALMILLDLKMLNRP